MAKIGRRLKAAFDAYRDPLTGRGSSKDRTQRLLGGTNVWSDQDLFGRYASNGFMQRVIEGPADDSTREGFNIENPDQDIDTKVQVRLKELGVKQIEREMVKYAGIYPKGCAAFIGVLAENLDEQMDLFKPMPQNIRRVAYLNLLSEPGEFNVHVRRALHPTARNYKEIYFTVQGVEVHRSRMLWISNEFNTRTAVGISRVNTVWDAIGAQDSALWSVSHLMQVLSMLVFKSDEFINLPVDEQGDILKKIREWIDTSGAMGVGKDEDLTRLNVALGGLGDVLDFIWKSIAGAAHQPVAVLVGKMQGVLTAGEEDLINYYNGISEFQEDKLEPEDRMLVDLLMRETQGAIKKPGLVYGIKYNTLWELSPSLQADVDKKNSERDMIDVQSGKAGGPEELRARDAYYSMLDQEPELEKEDKEQGRKQKEPAARGAPEVDRKGSLIVDGAHIAAGTIAFDRANLKGQWQRMQVRRPGLFKAKEFRVDTRRQAEGVVVVTGVMESTDQLATQGLLFAADWSEKQQQAWADKNLPGARHVVQYDHYGLGKFETDELARQTDRVEVKEKEIWIRLKSPGAFDQDHGFKSRKVKGAKGLRAIAGRLQGKMADTCQSLRFDKDQWSVKEAEKWVKKNKAAADSLVPMEQNIEVSLLPWHDFQDDPMMSNEALDAERQIMAWQGVLHDGSVEAYQSITFHGDQWTKEKAATWLDTELPKQPKKFAKLEASRKLLAKRGTSDG